MRKAVLIVVLTLSPAAAFAYFDPGTGSLLIQAIIGGLAAVVVFWGNVKAYVRRLFAGRKADSEHDAAEDDAAKRDSGGH